MKRQANHATHDIGEHPAGWLLSVWLAGLLVVSGRRALQWWRLKTVLWSSSSVDIPAPIPVRETPAALEPAVCGILWPVLLLPAGMAEQLSAQERDAVLAHELCHWHRRDNLAAAAHMLVEALFWFHPLVWWLGGRMIMERERACDEAVIESGGDRQTYAEGILKLCRLYLAPAFPCSPAVSGGPLRKRIEEIMTHPVISRLSLTKRSFLIVASLASIAVPVALGLAGSSPALAQPLSVALPSGQTVELRHYSNTQRGFELNVPKNWNEFPPPANAAAFFASTAGDFNTTGIVVLRVVYDATTSPAEFLSTVETAVAKDGFTNLVHGTETIGSRQALTVDMEKALPNGQTLHVRHYHISDGSLRYTLAFNTTSTRVDTVMALAQQVAKSFTYREHAGT